MRLKAAKDLASDSSRFSRSAFWDDVRRHGTTVSLHMPAMLSMLLTDPPHGRKIAKINCGSSSVISVVSHFSRHRPHLIGLPLLRRHRENGGR
jgi:hypothetical protein